MRNRLMGIGVALAFVALCCSSAFGQDAGGGPAGAGRGGRGGRGGDQAQAKSTLPFDPHNLSGVWLLATPFAGLSNEPPPFTPWGQAKYMANKPSYGPTAVPPALGNDVIGNCDPTGFPRNLFSPSRPVQFVQTPTELLQVFQYRSVWRQIWLDGRDFPKDLDSSWYGYSIGKWDGDTLVVNTRGLDERTWLDHFGHPHSADMRVEERYQRTDHDTFELVVTVDDPKTYTRPWVTGKKIFKWNEEQALDEEYCVPSEEQSFNSKVRNPAGGAGKN